MIEGRIMRRETNMEATLSCLIEKCQTLFAETQAYIADAQELKDQLRRLKDTSGQQETSHSRHFPQSPSEGTADVSHG